VDRSLIMIAYVCKMYPFTHLQVMVFVHARNATVKTAMSLRELATNYGDLQLFQPEQTPRLGQAEKQVSSIVVAYMVCIMHAF